MLLPKVLKIKMMAVKDTIVPVAHGYLRLHRNLLSSLESVRVRKIRHLKAMHKDEKVTMRDMLREHGLDLEISKQLLCRANGHK